MTLQQLEQAEAARLRRDLAESQAEVVKLSAAIADHRAQKADDRCIEDDDRLYAALGDGIKCDRRVGDKAAMRRNCERFIERRCEGGGWPSYVALEEKLAESQAREQAFRSALSEALGAGHNLKAFAGALLRWGEPGVDVSDEARRVVDHAERWHRLIVGVLAAPTDNTALREFGLRLHRESTVNCSHDCGGVTFEAAFTAARGES